MKKVITCLILAGILITLLSFSVHKYYLSLTNIDYIAESKSVQITSRVFIDDLELALNQINGKDFELDTKDEIKDSNKFINNYLKGFLKIKINNKISKFNYLGKKYDNDVVYLFAEIENVSTITSIEIKNRVLMDHFPDQQNIIKLKINDKKKSFILTSDNDKDLLKF